MEKLSTGDDATLGNYRKLASAVFGEDSGAVKFLDEKIAVQGAEEPVFADERQMILLLASMRGER